MVFVQCLVWGASLAHRRQIRSDQWLAWGGSGVKSGWIRSLEPFVMNIRWLLSWSSRTEQISEVKAQLNQW